MYRIDLEGRSRKGVFLAVGGLCIAAGLAVLLTGCTTARIPLTKIDVPVPNIPLPDLSFLTNPIFHRGSDNLRNLKWLDAFEAMHLRIVAEYPFAEWRGIDWDALGSAAREAIDSTLVR